MKKSVFTFALALLTAGSAWAYDFKAGDLYYNITDASNKTVEVTYEADPESSDNYKSLPGTVTIPATVSHNDTEYSVTSIGEKAFMSCTILKQVTIPNSVTSIGDSAFDGCSALTQITIPDGVTSLGNKIFNNCSALAQVVLPDGIEQIGNSTFSGCSALTQISIPSTVESIGDQVFYNCSRLTQITLPDGVKSIGNTAFASCSALTEISLPDNIENIGNSAFSGCSKLANITIPGRITSIGSQTFFNCSALTGITIPDKITNIGDEAFRYCSALTQINMLPTTPPTITPTTFSHINLQVRITIPDGSKESYTTDTIWKQLLDLAAGQINGTCGDNLTWIFTTADSTLNISGTGSMYDYNDLNQPSWNIWDNFNKNIKTIIMSDGVTSIGNSIFSGCTALTQITIPDNVESIGNSAFSDCSKLKQITIPESIKSAGSGAFYGCNALNAVYYAGNVAGWCGIIFSNTNANPLYNAHNLYINNTLVTELTIPESVTAVGEDCFGNSGVKNVVWNSNCDITEGVFERDAYGDRILSSVTLNKCGEIAKGAFTNATIQEMTVNLSTPPAFEKSTRQNINAIYVPAESVEAYKTATGWSEYADVITAIQ